jgi:REP element-mobilizing transposase RayT
VVKVPRFTFEKFPEADATLTTRMKSVGEAMAIGRTFKEALQKALRSLEIKRFGLCGDGREVRVDEETLRRKLSVPNAERIFYLAQAFQDGMSIEEVFGLTKIDPWFLRNIAQVVEEATGLGHTAGRNGIRRHVKDTPAREQRSTGILPVGPPGVSPGESANGSPTFQGIDPHATATITERNLPHWRQDGATYFVTFRLADAVPADVRRQWKEELEAWQKLHPEPWDAKTKHEYQRRFREDRERWLDSGHGNCLLREPKARDIVERALRHFDRERYTLDVWVIMPNHVHAILQPAVGQELSAILHSWKSFIATQVNAALKRSGPLWQDENFDRIVRGPDELERTRTYLRKNPDKAGLREGEFSLGDQAVLCSADDSPGETPGGPPGKMPVLQSRGAAPDAQLLRRAKKLGFSDRQLAHLLGATQEEIRALRVASAITPTYRLVDTCAAEFEAYTPYYYSTYGDENEIRPNEKRKIIILGGGPNRIGQGIEFDYCCVHAAFALRELGIETIMVNSNPETVSTDYDTSDKLYFEPLTHEDVLNIYEQEKPEGVIVQFGGQTPLNLAAGLKPRVCRLSVPNPRASNSRKTENFSPKCSIGSACVRRRTVPRPAKRKQSKSRSGSVIRCSLGHRSCLVAARWS